jgi:hypothetical protein
MDLSKIAIKVQNIKSKFVHKKDQRKKEFN